MNRFYLEVCFRRGRATAAYPYLHRKSDDKVHRTERGPGGLLIDMTEDDRTIGIEMTNPGHVRLDNLNRVLLEAGFDPVDAEEIAPLDAA